MRTVGPGSLFTETWGILQVIVSRLGRWSLEPACLASSSFGFAAY